MDIKIKLYRDSTFGGEIHGIFYDESSQKSIIMLIPKLKWVQYYFSIKKSFPEWDILDVKGNPISDEEFREITGKERQDFQCYTYNVENHDIIKTLFEKHRTRLPLTSKEDEKRLLYIFHLLKTYIMSQQDITNRETAMKWWRAMTYEEQYFKIIEFREHVVGYPHRGPLDLTGREIEILYNQQNKIHGSNGM